MQGHFLYLIWEGDKLQLKHMYFEYHGHIYYILLNETFY